MEICPILSPLSSSQPEISLLPHITVSNLFKEITEVGISLRQFGHFLMNRSERAFQILLIKIFKPCNNRRAALNI